MFVMANKKNFIDVGFLKCLKNALKMLRWNSVSVHLSDDAVSGAMTSV